MYSYDGSRYYNLRGEGNLEISNNPITQVDWAMVWVGFNPVYNPFLYMFEKPVSPFVPASLISGSSLIEFGSIFSDLSDNIFKFEKNGSSGDIKFNGKFPLPVNVTYHGAKGDTFSWNISSFYSIKAGEKSIDIPSKITGEMKDSAGRIMPSSYEIELSPESVKLITQQLPDSAFQVPLVYVKNAYDIDNKITLKSSDLVK